MEHRGSRLDAALSRSTLDAVLTTSPEQASYLANAYSPIHRLLPERPVVVLVARGAEPVVICAAIEERFIREVSGAARVAVYESTAELHKAICAEVSAAGLSKARIGVDHLTTPVGIYRALADAYPGAELADAHDPLGWALAVKSDAAIASIGAAATATDEAEWSALAGFGGGSEVDLATRLRRSLIDHGAEGITFLTLAGSARRATPQSPPSSREFHSGELVRFDLGGSFGGWMSDLARTVAIGHASAQQASRYSLAWEALHRHTERLRAGAVAHHLYGAVVADLARAGVTYTAPHVGHGIGYGTHEWPLLSPESDAVLEPRMVLCSEVIFSYDNGETYHLEECVEITDDAPRPLSRSRELPDRIPVLEWAQTGRA